MVSMGYSAAGRWGQMNTGLCWVQSTRMSSAVQGCTACCVVVVEHKTVWDTSIKTSTKMDRGCFVQVGTDETQLRPRADHTLPSTGSKTTTACELLLVLTQGFVA